MTLIFFWDSSNYGVVNAIKTDTPAIYDGNAREMKLMTIDFESPGVHNSPRCDDAVFLKYISILLCQDGDRVSQDVFL
jgi:hypothetical protein